MDIIHCVPRRRIHLTVSRIEFQSAFLFNKWFAIDGYFIFMFLAVWDNYVPEIW